LEFAPGIHKVDSIHEVNCYVLVGEEGLLVVDTGLPGKAKNILNYVKKLGWNQADIKYVVLTHADLDHIGAAIEIKKLTAARIAIHAADVPVLTGRQKFKTTNNFLGPLVGRVISLFPFEPVEPDLILNDGDLIAGWTVVGAPGHTPGSICLYQPGKALLVGDALRTSWRARPRPISRRICLDIRQARDSLWKIADLDYKILLPGHGAPILQGASQIVREMVIKRADAWWKAKKILGVY
jgi:glyoxylase-like metal-dependent hydrolase (beta-lactamase superfamily II)